MTQKEAIIKALEEHGGRERLPVIYPRVIQLATFKPGSDKQATIRTTLQRHPECFRHSPGKPDGWWELVSFQEDIAWRDQRIKELEEDNAQLKNIKTEDAFVQKFVQETKHFLHLVSHQTSVILPPFGKYIEGIGQRAQFFHVFVHIHAQLFGL